MDPERKPDDIELCRLAMRIDKHSLYRLQVALFPDDEETRGRLHADHGRSFAKEAFYSLKKWVKCCRLKPTFACLRNILQDCGINVHVLCQVCMNSFHSDISLASCTLFAISFYIVIYLLMPYSLLYLCY